MTRWLSGEKSPAYLGFIATGLGFLAVASWQTASAQFVLYGLCCLSIAMSAVAAGVCWRQKPEGAGWIWCSLIVNLLAVGHVVVAPIHLTKVEFLGDFHRVGLLLIVNLAVMLCAFRVGAFAYAVLALAFGAIAAWDFDLASGFVATALLCALMIVMNYAIQLCLDHRRELRLAINRARTRGWRFLTIGRVVLIVSPAVVLVAIGAMLNAAIQSQLKDVVYQSGVLDSDPSMKGERELQRDAHYTIEKHRALMKERYVSSIDNLSAQGGVALDAIPKATTDLLEGMRPADVDKGPACRNAEVRVLRQRITFRNMCGDLVNAVNEQIRTSFNRAKSNIERKVRARVDEAKGDRKAAFDNVKSLGVRELDEAFDSLDTATMSAFTAASIYSMLSYAFLACALVAAVQMIVGRFIFQEEGNPNSEHSFKLLPARNPERLEFIHAHELRLNDEDVSENIRDWYVSTSIARRGQGTEMALSVPQPLGCFFQRIFSDCLIVTRIRVIPEVRAARGNNAPRISVPGDHKLIRITLKPAQQLCFRMSDVVAFTDGVKFQSIYTTYIGAHFLGLGSFYGVAMGSGYLVLKSEGEQIAAGLRNAQTPAVNLLAWDRAHEFVLAQRLDVKGVWFNDPSLVLRSDNGCAVLDESCSSRFPLAVRIWSLVRYLFLPV